MADRAAWTTHLNTLGLGLAGLGLLGGDVDLLEEDDERGLLALADLGWALGPLAVGAPEVVQIPLSVAAHQSDTRVMPL